MSRQIEQRVERMEVETPQADAQKVANRLRLRDARLCVGEHDPWQPSARDKRALTAHVSESIARALLTARASHKPRAYPNLARRFLELSRADAQRANAVLAAFKRKNLIGVKPEHYASLLAALDKELAALSRTPAPVPVIVTEEPAPVVASKIVEDDSEIDEVDWLKKAEREAIRQRGVFTITDLLNAQDAHGRYLARRRASRIAPPPSPADRGD